MSFLTPVANAGYNAQAANATTLVITLTASIGVGRFAVVRVGNRGENDPADPESGATNRHVSVVDSKGNSYDKLGEASHGAASGDSAVAVSAWIGTITTALEIGDTITVTFDASRRGRHASVEEYQAEEDGSTIAVVDADVGHGRTTGGGGAISVTLTPASGDLYTWIGAGIHGGRDVGGVTLDAAFTTDRAPVILDNGFQDSSTLWGQERGLFDTSMTWDATLLSNQSWAMVLSALLVTPPPAPPPEAGTREYQADFETADHGTIEASTERRPDAVTRSMLHASCDGPVAIGVLTDGVQAYRWQARTTDGFTVEVRRSNAGITGWGQWAALFTVTGTEPIEELDIAFNVDARIVVAMQRPNGTAGADRVNLYRWNDNPMVLAYEVKGVVDGYSPRIISDYFPSQVLPPHICPPEVDVQLFYIRPGVGMERRQESDDWDVAYPTVVGYHSGRRVEEAVKTTDRRVSVILSRRTASTGRYAMERADSVPYTDALLRRPTFENWSSPAADLMASGYQAWYDPTSQTTQTWHLRVSTAQDVDAIEVQASGDFPSGIAPTFPLDNQESGPLSAGGIHDFDFSVTHGGGTLSHVAFRARTRREILGVTCYSPWRYTVIPPTVDSPPATTPGDFLVNCSRDMLIDLPSRMAWLIDGLIEGVREYDTNNPCDSEQVFSIGNTGPGGTHPGWWWVGGEFNTSSLQWFQRFTLRRRPWIDLQFVDDDGILHVGRVLGDAVDQTAGSPVTKAFDWPGHRWPRQFPDDTGRYPNIGVSLDVIAST